MFDELLGRISAMTSRLKQAHAMLNLFETDFGRPGVAPCGKVGGDRQQTAAVDRACCQR